MFFFEWEFFIIFGLVIRAFLAPIRVLGVVLFFLAAVFSVLFFPPFLKARGPQPRGGDLFSGKRQFFKL